jgi:hypothetical protein
MGSRLKHLTFELAEKSATTRSFDIKPNGKAS